MHTSSRTRSNNRRLGHEEITGMNPAQRLFHTRPGAPVGTTDGMQPANRTATVLFAEPSSGTKRSEASRKALARAVVSIAEATGGRVIKTIGGKLMVVFA